MDVSCFLVIQRSRLLHTPPTGLPHRSLKQGFKVNISSYKLLSPQQWIKPLIHGVGTWGVRVCKRGRCPSGRAHTGCLVSVRSHVFMVSSRGWPGRQRWEMSSRQVACGLLIKR